MDIQTRVKLNNGVMMPILGLGVYKSKEETYQAVQWALEEGYRHIDTAAFYENEDLVGKAVKDSSVAREDIFVVTKVWNTEQEKSRQREAFEKSLRALDMEYVDLYLVHWPIEGKHKETWKILEQLYDEGLVKSIGVSNFQERDLDLIMKDANVIPVVNQIEIQPFYNRRALIEYCEKREIICEAWRPLGAGKILADPVLNELAQKYNKTTAQIILRWNIQQGLITIPKSVNRERIIQNAAIFDFEIDQEDMYKINTMKQVPKE